MHRKMPKKYNQSRAQANQKRHQNWGCTSFGGQKTKLKEQPRQEGGSYQLPTAANFETAI